jgi:hypothetical protein
MHKPNIHLLTKWDRVRTWAGGDDSVIGEGGETPVSPDLFIEVMLLDRWSISADWVPLD